MTPNYYEQLGKLYHAAIMNEIRFVEDENLKLFKHSVIQGRVKAKMEKLIKENIDNKYWVQNVQLPRVVNFFNNQ